MQLLKIKTIPIKYNIDVRNASITVPEIEPADLKLDSTPLKIENETHPIQVRMDSSNMRRSMGMKTIADIGREAPAKTQQTANRVTSEYVQMGNKMANGHANGITVAQLMREKSLENITIESTIGRIPTEKIDMSWEPATIKHSVQRSEVTTDWQKAAQEMEFIPSSITLEIEQLADVEIEYIGGYQYVPPSSDPDYKE
ncbi:MAG: DUF6470 family protein [Porcipelethomonas sp.]